MTRNRRRTTSDREMVTITEAEYERLLDSERWLDCLEAAGVDNWQGIDYAYEIQREWQQKELSQ